MSTIKFVPMEFFAQFALTQMRRLQARGAVGAAFSGAGRGWWAQVAVCTAFPARGAYCERWALSARLSGSGNIVGGRGALFAGVGCCRRARGRCLRAWGAVGAAFSSTGTSLADVESCWWEQVAVCTAFPARGAYCERWALSARLSGSGNIVGGRGELLVGVGALLAGVGRCRRARVAVCAAFSGARERRPVLRTPPPFRAAHGACRSACPLAARTHPSSMVRARRLPVGRTPPPFRAAHGACRSACPLAARPPPFRRAACRFAA